MIFHFPHPYAWETTGYEVNNLYDTHAKARSAGIQILVASHQIEQRETVMVQFPRAYIAEIHSVVKK